MPVLPHDAPDAKHLKLLYDFNDEQPLDMKWILSGDPNDGRGDGYTADWRPACLPEVDAGELTDQLGEVTCAWCLTKIERGLQ